MRKLSLHHLTMLDAHPLQLADAAHAGGFDYYGLRVVAPPGSGSVVDVANDQTLFRELRVRAESTGVWLLDIEAFWLHPDVCTDALRPALEVGHTLGAKHVLAVGNDPVRSRLVDAFSRLCEMAAQFNMTVGLEPITYCPVGTVSDALAVIRESGQSNARLLIDVLQYFRSGAEVQAIRDVPSGLVEYLQLCDGLHGGPASAEGRQKEARTERLLPGDGEFPLHALLANMPPDLTLSVEAPSSVLRGLSYDEQARLLMKKAQPYIHGPS
ncbi:TIM barrel protein [Burkholderia cenocepacia]|uniref:sugar phosphate isomerase/epimerase family protein n=1 Tax=Burkholderia cenocepacia TaxID=95486 RepID=UPI001B9B1CD2|nr:TIM barrel protein [Burkholderia cenocepacia]MBR8030089.1 TIM barrel protein [Burkholderia cenocepacia]MBR8174214.1 TIM barrel protein [Burkholderia cenocepacia]